MELVVFVLASLMAVVGAVGVVVRRNPVHAAMSLVLTLFGIAVIFVQQGAHFLAAVQVIVYAGAIVVLFLFVIMLLGVDQAEDLSIEPLTVQRPLAAVIGVAMVGLLTGAVLTSDNAVMKSGAGLSSPTLDSPDANVKEIAGSIFGDHVFAFEITSILLLVAVVGTVILARRLPKEEVAK
ncbi:MAG: NADH-quinone oxidoreductase subunit [Actinomycetota bacterium]|jgi:NADH-quinone oxidoreductase subunit J|nr:NADH-quinone oxidoreductase subunit J [Actinomycetota bacterium]